MLVKTKRDKLLMTKAYSNVGFGDLDESYRYRGEGPQSALHVEMCMVQHL
jgi:hypothetical protein